MDPKSETPLRRSRANLSIRETIQTPLINDDDAERRQSRMVSEAMETTPVTLVSEKEGLLGCLKIFSENKINKSNAWNMSLIDNFAALVGKHHKSMRDFQFIGTTLEASCKIYGLRVDSVHADVINMATGLCKFTINTAENDESNAGAAGGDGDNGGGLNTSGQTAATTSTASKAAARKAKRKAGARCTIVKNTSTINAKLETYPLSEPTFAKLNTTIGDINSSKRLLNYVLASADSELKHRSNLPFWDGVEHPVCEFNENDVYAEEQAAQVRLGGLGRMLADDLVMRQELRGYRITNAPATCEDDDDDDAAAAHDASVQALPLDQSHIDLAFDINADIEPIAEPPAEYMDTGFDNDELEHMDADDMRAICAVRSLRRNVTALDDMRPVDSTSSQLEYSYRPLDNISRFWAGPSYWKIQRSRRTGASLGPGGAVNADVGGGGGGGGGFLKRQQQQQQRRPAQRRKFEPIEFVPDEDFDDSMFISVNSAEAQKLRKINIYKRWDPKKLRLPTNLHLDRQRYDKYFYAPGLRVEWSKEPAHSVISQTAAYDYNNAEDREYCSNIRSDDEAAASPEPGGDGAHEVPQGAADLSGSGGGGLSDRSMVGVIGTEFAGRAPDKIERIDIPFARRAKVIDMKQLKRCCLSLIDRQRGQMSPGTQLPCSQMLNPESNRLENLRYECGAATFTQTLAQLPQVLSADQRAAVSTSTSFYSILHLANEQHLDLISIDAEDFFIRQLEDRG